MTLIQMRRGNPADWAAQNPTLAEGEVGVELGDPPRWKLGDGSKPWSELAYSSADWSAITGMPAVIAAGDTQAAAREAIDAKAADYTPSSDEIVAALGFTPVDQASRAQANGVASLDGSGKVPVSQLPSSIMEYQGTYNAATNTPALVDGTGNAGDVYRVSTGGTRNFGSGGITLHVGDYVIYSGSIWEKSATTDTVASIAGLSGDVTGNALKTALALGSVDNTADAAKVVASAGKLTTPRNINGVPFDGTANITVADSTKLPASGTAVAAAKLATPRNINGVPFDGTANIEISTGGWRPSHYGWIEWAYDVTTASTQAALTAGTVHLIGIQLAAACTISNIILPVQGNLTGGVAGQNFVGLYQGGNLLAASADQISNWAAPGVKTIPLTTPQSVAAGLVYVAVVSNASTQISLSRSGTLYIANAGLAANGCRFATADTGRTTLPATLGTQTPSTTTFWAAVA